MHKILLPIILLIFMIDLIRRLFAAFSKISRKSESQDKSNNTPNPMVKDPICGMYMDSRLAVRIDGRRKVVYFCSEECKDKYLNRTTGEAAGTAAGL
jgi:uncharacterized protein